MSQSYNQILNWDTPNGRLLRKFVDGLPQDRPIVLNVFGSTPRPVGTFIASLTWRDRAQEEVFGNVTLYVAHPMDVLVDRIKNLKQSDLDAFDWAVTQNGCFPAEDEMKEALMNVVDMYRPAFDEENPGGDPIANTRRLWKHLYGHDIDVRAEIIRPALEIRKEAYGQNAPDRRAILREIAECVR